MSYSSALSLIMQPNVVPAFHFLVSKGICRWFRRSQFLFSVKLQCLPVSLKQKGEETHSLWFKLCLKLMS